MHHPRIHAACNPDHLAPQWAGLYITPIATVQPMDWADATPEFAARLTAHCKIHLSPVKCPRSVDFDPALPRLDIGKLYKRLVKDRYWQDKGKKV